MESLNSIFKEWKKNYENNVVLLGKEYNHSDSFLDKILALSKEDQRELSIMIENHKKERAKELLFICVN
jgi:histidinol phosphatase-like PHP family hydrolase